jgi:hypothetical protein
MKKIEFEVTEGSGYIEYISRDETGKNDTFDIVVEEVYSFYSEDDVIAYVERNIYKHI